MRHKIIIVLFALACLEYLGVSVVFTDFSVLFHHGWSGRGVESLGLVFMMVPLVQFLAAPMMGSLSDRYGRRPLLLFSSFISMVGFVLTAIALARSSFILLLLSRAISGLAVSNIGIIQAAMTDVTAEKKRAGGFNILLIATGLGLSIGPVIGGVLADPRVVPWFNAATPFWCLGVISVVIFGVVYVLFQEPSRSVIERQKFWRIATDPVLRIFLVIWVLFMGGWTLYENYFNLLMNERHFHLAALGGLSAFIGVLSLVYQIFLVQPLASRCRPITVLKFSSLGVGLSILWMTQVFHLASVLVVLIIYAGFMAFFLPNILALISTRIRLHAHGSVFGVVASLRALTALLVIPIGGVLVAHAGAAMVLIVGGLLIMTSWVMIICIRERRESEHDVTINGQSGTSGQGRSNS